MKLAGLGRDAVTRTLRLGHLARRDFGPYPSCTPRGARIAIGARVEVEDEGMGRTSFLAPVGAGVELAGPGGDGFPSVVTPLSPVGKAVLGRRGGETVEVTVQGEPREWTITYATETTVQPRWRTDNRRQGSALGQGDGPRHGLPIIAEPAWGDWVIVVPFTQ